MTSSVLERPSMPAPAGPPRGLVRCALAAFLRVPLLLKLLGANVLLVVAALAAHELLPRGSTTAQVWITLGLSLVVSMLLVWLALRPLAELEDAAERVSEGDFAARVPGSAIADPALARLSGTMNRLLDRVEADRERIRYLAGRAVRARDIEREAVARELRESLAQMLSAASLQLAVARQHNADPAVDAQLRAAGEIITMLNDELRVVAESLYPGTLGELGLRNALEAMARSASRRGRVRVDVDAGMFDAPLTTQAASALYRAADEALRNVLRHAGATSVRMRLSSGDSVVLEVEDDGCGMDLRARDPMQAGLGLFSAQAVLALAGGQLQISSAPGRGTRVVATIPISHMRTAA